MKTFEMNGKSYKTDAGTLEVLRSVIPAAKENNDFSAVTVILTLGLHTGRITEAS